MVMAWVTNDYIAIPKSRETYALVDVRSGETWDIPGLRRFVESSSDNEERLFWIPGPIDANE